MGHSEVTYLHLCGYTEGKHESTSVGMVDDAVGITTCIF